MYQFYPLSSLPFLSALLLLESAVSVSLPYTGIRYEADVACKWILEKKGLTGYQVKVPRTSLNVKGISVLHELNEYMWYFHYPMKFDFLRKHNPPWWVLIKYLLCRLEKVKFS